MFWIAAVMAATTACPPGGDPNIAPTKIDWLQQPSGQQIQWAYPPKAAAQGLGGKAVITCDVDTHGAISNCKVIAETPEGMGFGEAALSLRADMRLVPATRCGVPIAAQVTVPLEFALPADAPPPSGPPPSAEALALGHRLVTAMNFTDSIGREMQDALQEQAYPSAGESNVSADERRAVHEAARDAWESVRGDAEDRMAEAVARLIGVEDLKAIVAFHESPPGRRLQEQAPAMSQFLETELGDLAPAALKRFNDINCKRVGNCEAKKILEDFH